MKNIFKFSTLILVSVFMFILGVSALALDLPADFTTLSNDELSEVSGQGRFFIRNIDNLDFDADIDSAQFTYSDISDGAFKDASGLISVIQVPGDRNWICVYLDLDLSIINTYGTTTINLSDQQFELPPL